jgi:hypothetical protein
MGASAVSFMLIIFFLVSPSFAQTIKLVDLLNAQRTDSIHMKDLFAGNQFSLVKTITEDRKTGYVYKKDSSSTIGITTITVSDSAYQVIWVDFAFTDEQNYKELDAALRQSNFEQLSHDIVKGANGTKVKAYKTGASRIILSKSDPKVFKFPFYLTIQNMGFNPFFRKP